jgi:hypothetical protein
MGFEQGLKSFGNMVEWKLTAAQREKEVTGTPIIIRAEGWQRE